VSHGLILQESFKIPTWFRTAAIADRKRPHFISSYVGFVMAFRKFVEAGRVAFIADGPEEGKLCAIVNIIDQNRVLVDGPCSGVTRQELSIKRLHLTTLGLKYPFSASTRVVRKAWTAEKIDEKWKNSRWAQRVAARNTRANLSDFDRFKLNGARRTRNKIRRNVYLQLLLNAKKKGALNPPKTRYGRKKTAAKPPAKTSAKKK